MLINLRIFEGPKIANFVSNFLVDKLRFDICVNYNPSIDANCNSNQELEAKYTKLV